MMQQVDYFGPGRLVTPKRHDLLGILVQVNSPEPLPEQLREQRQPELLLQPVQW